MSTGFYPMGPEKRVAKGVSLIVFGGILNVMAGLVALVGSASLTRGVYPWISMAVGAALIVCTRGLRRAWVPMLYVGAAVLIGSSVYFGYALSQAFYPGVLIQVPVGVWLLWVLHRISAPLKRLHSTGARADRSNPYHQVFLRRFS